MKLKNKLIACAALAALGLVWQGCQTHTSVMNLGGGYEAVTHPNHALLDEPDPPRISFQHRNADGTVTKIWPSLYSADDVIKGDLAIFVADKAYIEPEHVTHPRLFAVKFPELPMDLTDEVLWRWSKEHGKDFNVTLQKFAAIAPVEKAGMLEVRIDFWNNQDFGAAREDWPDNSSVRFEWRQIDEMIRAVKSKGVVEKDLRWHTAYLGEKF